HGHGEPPPFRAHEPDPKRAEPPSTGGFFWLQIRGHGLVHQSLCHANDVVRIPRVWDKGIPGYAMWSNVTDPLLVAP
ncbi:MAG: hypothetical protein EB058_13260, partial [Proteobacteria bacterium]|nr:hypothetical protein [Pseudomonadota bacterium]